MDGFLVGWFVMASWPEMSFHLKTILHFEGKVVIKIEGGKSQCSKNVLKTSSLNRGQVQTISKGDK